MDKNSARAIEAVADTVKTFVKRFSDGTGRFDPSHKERRDRSKMERRIRNAFTNEVIKKLKKQDNLEQIGQMVLPMLAPDAELEKMSSDFLLCYREKASLASDKDIQLKWARIFAGEAESPGSFSKWALNAVSCMTKEDIDAFTKLASCVWKFGPNSTDYEVVYWRSSRKIVPLPEYILERTGLVRGFGSPLEGWLNVVHKQAYVQYFDKEYAFRFPDSLDVPRGTPISLTLLGKELHRLCDATPNEEYLKDCLAQWKSKGVELLHTKKVV